MRSVFHEKGANFALDNFQTLQEAIDQSNFTHRIGLYLVSAFAGMAILMVAAGLYGVLSQYVSSRRRELGVRMALGATRREVLLMILRRGSLLILLGLGIGIALSLSVAKLVKSFLFGVAPLDVAAYLVAIFLLLALGNIAALTPAIRAAGIDPSRARRDEYNLVRVLLSLVRDLVRGDITTPNPMAQDQPAASAGPQASAILHLSMS
jgi:ABC-type antimicrobial peptide transport system permease subunit